MTQSRKLSSRLCPHSTINRKGGIVILMGVLLPVIFVMAAFVINISYLQLTRTELLIATDASARAAGRAWSHYQDIDDAKTAARVTAALNTVAGSPLLVSFDDSDDEIEFGDSGMSDSHNRFEFSKLNTALVASHDEQATSVRINGKLTDSSQNGALRTLFPGMGLKDSFQLTQSAVATQLDRDIALVLDRSGSMGWVDRDWPDDPWDRDVRDAAVDAGILYTYTYYDGKKKKKKKKKKTGYAYTEGNDEDSYYKWAWEEYFDLGPYPQSPWEDLVQAVDTFLGVLEETDQNEQVSLATYSHSATLDLNLVEDYDRIQSELASITPNGATAIGYGLQEGLTSLLNNSFARPFAAKTIIVMTDGIHNHGSNPVQVARDIVADYKFTIHTVTFGEGADQSRMRQIAEIGGGEHYHAETGAELIEVFDEIANNLPTLITQ